MPDQSIKTHHCRFCNHLLLATTRDLSTLPRRREPGRDAAVILPLPVSDAPDDDEDDDDLDKDEDEDEDGNDEAEGDGVNTAQKTEPSAQPETRTEKEQQTTSTSKPKQEGKEYSILLSTTLPDRRAVLVRRDDGFEKRTMLRCGRCRVVVGYFLDKAHFGSSGSAGGAAGNVVYLLPAALVDTGSMGNEQVMKMVDREWSSW